MLSVQGGRSARYCFQKKPSEYIPFKGEFPILPEYRVEELYDQIHKHKYLSECEKWAQDAIIKADRIFLMEDGFKKFLQKQNKFDDFFDLKNNEKANLLVKYMDENCLGWDSLRIR